MFKYAAKPSAMTSEGMSSGNNIERRSYVKTDKIRSPTEIESVPTEHKRIHGGKNDRISLRALTAVKGSQD